MNKDIKYLSVTIGFAMFVIGFLNMSISHPPVTGPEVMLMIGIAVVSLSLK